MTPNFYCWIKGRGEPSKMHLTYEEAKQEAARLADREGKEVLIIQVVGGYWMEKHYWTMFAGA